jgi:hypothetical protein
MVCVLMVCCSCAAALPSRQEQLADLQTKQMLVFMWGWSAQEMAPVAERLGFQAVFAPSGNDIKGRAAEVATWSEYGFKMIARPSVPVKDPFDPEDVRGGCEELRRVFSQYDKNPDIIGFCPFWGLYGEGGFPHDYVFTDKARDAFNKWMNTPGEPLPTEPSDGQPGSLRYVRWNEFRSKTLREFRRTYVAAAKEVTQKLVGTWSEFYPIENYKLNMGEAPGADFLMYDLSFGDVTTDQTIAFAECHGDMQHYETFEKWRDHELPLMAKAAGEGVIPIAFQFPMRRGHATDFLSKTTVFTDRVEDEYSLRSGPDIRALIDAARGGVRKPEAALVYQSFEASALPGGGAFWFYQPSARFIGGMLHQMGVDVKVIPYEHLESLDLSEFKIVIVPDPMYLNDAMRANLTKARRVLYSGEYMLTHRDPATAKGDFNTGWSGVTKLDGLELRYALAPAGPLSVVKASLTNGIEIDPKLTYPADQMMTFDTTPKDTNALMKVGDAPIILIRSKGRVVHVANRFFNHAYSANSDALEKIAFTFVRNLMIDCGVRIRVDGPALVRVKDGFPYGSYGITGCIGWNKTGSDVKLRLVGGQSVTIPRYGWTKLTLPR